MDLDDLTLDVTYRLQGRAATYMPPSGSPVEGILICFHQPQSDIASPGVSIGQFDLGEKPQSLLVRSNQVERPVSDALFILDTGARLRIAEAIEHDAEGREWRCRYVSDT